MDIDISKEPKLLKAMADRARAELLKKEAKLLAQEADKHLRTFMALADTPHMEHAKYGQFAIVEGTTTSKLDIKQFKANLLLKGVSLATLNDALIQSTTAGTRAGYIKYTPPGAKKR